ncbi:related to Alpha-factor-transporting ATPase [Saccharomycodes ludwigii]|uniref:Related to Alpha-factor-transporting ATPase n=1 Tax=Saccharomycodes ludwigii TaxID=36035 RepID=A0A376B944_9ASCO|nr:related to Alpha-factor-transporting ATPase [Saccharomycodes ludwigii]
MDKILNFQKHKTTSFLYSKNIYFFVDKSKDWKILLIISLTTIIQGIVPCIISILTGKCFGLLENTTSISLSSTGNINNQLTLKPMAILATGAAALPIAWVNIAKWMDLGERQSIRSRRRLLLGYLDKHMGWYDKEIKLSGSFTQTNRCVEELRNSSSQASAVIFQNFVTIISLILTAFTYSWSMTLVILASSPVIAIIASRCSTIIEKYTKLENNESMKGANKVLWCVDSQIMVKLFSTQMLELLNFRKIARNCNNYFIKYAFAFSLNQGCLRCLSLWMFVQGFWFANSQIKKNKLTTTNAMTCFSACVLLGATLVSSLHQIVALQRGKVALSQIQKQISINNSLEVQKFHAQQLISYVNPSCNIEFKGVSFSYPSRKTDLVLNHINISFQKNCTTFIIGKSGSGKSTLGNLLLKLYDNYEGSIILDGINLAAIDKDWLFSNITYVEQKCTLFNDTIKNNILMGSEDPTTVNNSLLKHSCQLALLENVLLNLPEGLNTIIGTNGISLSGGQQQKVALARAFYRNTPILILDEALSALDIVQRDLIMKAIRNHRAGKTTVILTHDLTQISSEDFVYLLENGEVKEFGLQKNLLKDVNSKLANYWFLQNIKTGQEEAKTPISHQTTVLDPNSSIYLQKNFTSSKISELKECLNDDDDLSATETITVPFYKENEKALSPGYLQKQADRNSILCGPDITGVLPEPFSILGKENNTSVNLKKSKNEKKRKRKTDVESGDVLGRLDPLPMKKVLFIMFSTIKHKKTLAIGLIFAIATGVTNPVFSFCFSKLLTAVVPNQENTNVGTAEYLIKWSLILFTVSFIDGVCTFFEKFLLNYCSEYWIMDLRILAMKKILDQDMLWYSAELNKASEISALLLNDLRDLRILASDFLGIILKLVLLAFIGLTWAIVVGWKLSLVCISLFPMFILFSGVYGSILQKHENNYKSAVSDLENKSYEIITSIKTIRILRLESYFLGQYAQIESKLKKIGRARAWATGFGVSVLATLTIAIQSIIYYYGLKLVITKEYSVEKMFETLTLLLFTIMSSNSLINSIPELSRGQRAATYVFNIIDSPILTERKDANPVRKRQYLIRNKVNGEKLIQVKNLSFSYPQLNCTLSANIYKNLNLTVNFNEKVGIVGDSGCGKSTLLSLFTKLYFVSNNTIFVDGTDINFWDINALRNNIGLVQQTPKFFQGTVRENLLYGLPVKMFNDWEIHESLKATNIYDFVMALPRRLDTEIDTNLMSGGQLQRLAISRSLLHNPVLLLLDECTSALDAFNADKIEQMIKNKIRNKSVLIVTHSKSMMKICDRLLVMKEGVICEEGTFSELMEKKGELYRIFNLDLQ